MGARNGRWVVAASIAATVAYVAMTILTAGDTWRWNNVDNGVESAIAAIAAVACASAVRPSSRRRVASLTPRSSGSARA